MLSNKCLPTGCLLKMKGKTSSLSVGKLCRRHFNQVIKLNIIIDDINQNCCLIECREKHCGVLHIDAYTSFTHETVPLMEAQSTK